MNPAPAATAASDPAGAIYVQPGEIRGRVQGSDPFRGDASQSVIEFGPRIGVPAGRFQLTVSDESGSLLVPGTYAYDGKHVELTLDVESVAMELEEVLESQGGLPADSVSLSCEGAAKVRIKAAESMETAASRLKLRCLASIVGVPEALRVRFSFAGKGERI